MLQPAGGRDKIYAKETAALEDTKSVNNKKKNNGGGTEGVSTWNLASAGRFQQYNDLSKGGMKQVKKLKLVTIEFDSVQGMCASVSVTTCNLKYLT